MELGSLKVRGLTGDWARQKPIVNQRTQTDSRRPLEIKSTKQSRKTTAKTKVLSKGGWIHGKPGENQTTSWCGNNLSLNQLSMRDCRLQKCSKRKSNIAVALLDDVPHLSEWVTDLPRYPNPLQDNPAYAYVGQYFVDESDVVVKDIVVKENFDPSKLICFRRAGPRKEIVFQPEEVRACIVTCGGLCPGLNTVIREIVYGLWNQYGVREIFGIDGGYRGFYARNIENLNPKVVNDIHKKGGTILHTSRGGHETSKIVNAIEDRGINQVYIIGGDGTQRGANVICKEIQRRGLKVAVAGVPKTIDNDIAVIDRSFGFDTAVEEAQRAINAAHVEAESVENGLGLVKVMGRYSGYIAMFATLASRDVDCCLIPEVPFFLEGEGGLYEFIKKRLRENGHMVLVVAEGAGQELIAGSMGESDSRDASGNRLLLDVGLWLSQKIKNHLVKEHKFPVNLKFIDPTYMIRAVPSNAADNVYCTLLAHGAIHGAMAGYSGFITGPVNGRHAYIPIERVTESTNKVNISDRMWARLLSSTQQPSFLTREEIERHQDMEEKELQEKHAMDHGNGTGRQANGTTPEPQPRPQPQSSQPEASMPHVSSAKYEDQMEEAKSTASVEGSAAGQ